MTEMSDAARAALAAGPGEIAKAIAFIRNEIRAIDEMNPRYAHASRIAPNRAARRRVRGGTPELTIQAIKLTNSMIEYRQQLDRDLAALLAA